MGLGFIKATRGIRVAEAQQESRYRVRGILSELFPKQLDYVTDPSRFKAAWPGRRAGKTTANRRLILKTAEENPKEHEEPPRTAFLSTTKGHAKRLVWQGLQDLAKRHRVPMEFHGTDLIAKHRNGHEVWVMGADNDRDIQRLRGFAWKLIVVDESQAIGAHMDSLVNEVIDAALEDYEGSVALTGTPNAACAGFFYDVANLDKHSRKWKRFHWTVLDNPLLPRWAGKADWRALSAKWMKDKKEINQWADDNPIYLREWMGRWVRDETGLVYKYDPLRNDYDVLPSGHEWRYIMGVDLGYKDAFAIVVLAFCSDLPDVYEVYSYKESYLITSQWAERIREVQKLYDVERIMVDTGGLGVAIAEEFKRRYQINVSPAQKKKKADYIELLNSDLVDGKLHVLKNGQWAGEMSRLQYAESKRDKYNKRVEDPSYPNHVCDAGLYAWREAQHWTYKPPPERTYEDEEEEKMWQEALKEAREQRGQNTDIFRGRR